MKTSLFFDKLYETSYRWRGCHDNRHIFSLFGISRYLPIFMLKSPMIRIMSRFFCFEHLLTSRRMTRLSVIQLCNYKCKEKHLQEKIMRHTSMKNQVHIILVLIISIVTKYLIFQTKTLSEFITSI